MSFAHIMQMANNLNTHNTRNTQDTQDTQATQVDQPTQQQREGVSIPTPPLDKLGLTATSFTLDMVSACIKRIDELGVRIDMANRMLTNHIQTQQAVDNEIRKRIVSLENAASVRPLNWPEVKITELQKTVHSLTENVAELTKTVKGVQTDILVIDRCVTANDRRTLDLEEEVWGADGLQEKEPATPSSAFAAAAEPSSAFAAEEPKPTVGNISTFGLRTSEAKDDPAISSAVAAFMKTHPNWVLLAPGSG